MTQIVITGVTGSTPITVYLADVYGNNRVFLGTITTGVPPTIEFTPSALFNNAPAVMLILVDRNGCEKFKILPCSSTSIRILTTENWIPISTESDIIFIV